MDKYPEHPTPAQAEERFRELLDDAGLDQPDEVEYDLEADELIFLWREQKVAIVLELSRDGSVGLRGGELPLPPV